MLVGCDSGVRMCAWWRVLDSCRKLCHSPTVGRGVSRVHLDLQVYGAADETGDYLADVQRKMKLNIIRNTPEELVFDMIGVDAPLANALRRILIAEVCVCVFWALRLLAMCHMSLPRRCCV